eukprot:CAMPEP_0179076682 /NCGR_PEP_ID=MMETSP0796-20121207/34226_1 /TAXON_ID=73915 /ORGANISM="Pyrodinium bahamense, Strain pbaha01" /LENGTH=128 /DNA_ID=CAMNT_0020773941 /DNA_START=89 /DNA_END=476 /DNA_ORIENTATION=-
MGTRIVYTGAWSPLRMRLVSVQQSKGRSEGASRRARTQRDAPQLDLVAPHLQSGPKLDRAVRVVEPERHLRHVPVTVDGRFEMKSGVLIASYSPMLAFALRHQGKNESSATSNWKWASDNGATKHELL